ncbi:hypothetical protein [Brevundimonas sp. A19_0]|uniref:hypothetical protein n=1 Tax=Brevundimonas sp. A19_0 TaxID=2821087 RepID=UPI001ADD0DC0|nr:hypothetical protein [Brevundimonas sp. A19_0]MBO9501889.1 hypothetical protein [Brevundimonas sp. A19_0]
MTSSRFLIGGLFAPAVLLLVAACASTPSGDDADAYVGMTIDVDRMTVTTPRWSSGLIDCSDDAVQCLEAPGRFLVSMQRTCDRSAEWLAGGQRYRAIGIMPHYGLPSASYMSMKYPHVHWYFWVGPGYSRWARTAGTPGDSSWDTNETIEEYPVRIIGSNDWFRCGQAS